MNLLFSKLMIQKIFLLIFSLSSLLLACSVVDNNPVVEPANVGLAEYAILSPQWPCDKAREAERDLPVLRKAVLWNSFGDDTECLLKYLKDPRLAALEIHLINEVCQRNNNCGPYEFLYGVSLEEYNRKLIMRDRALLRALRQYLSVVQKFVNENLRQSTVCYVNPGLESNLSREAAEVLIKETRILFPNCKIVWNPVGSSPYAEPIEGTVFELHGATPPLVAPCIADLDGVDISFPTRPALLPSYISSADIPQYLTRYSQCDITFLWIAEFNGLRSSPFIDPRSRPRSLFPTKSTLQLVVDLAS